MTTTDDILNEQWMRRAVELSKKGLPAPNPHVGCVIVKDGQLVGEGFMNLRVVPMPKSRH
jgi:diaminohydroxyphosphoribosylaminopyrimidine deaminase/5-amino-6-(5-phosphoribosylamino)uracil reductase